MEQDVIDFEAVIDKEPFHFLESRRLDFLGDYERFQSRQYLAASINNAGSRPVRAVTTRTTVAGGALNTGTSISFFTTISTRRRNHLLLTWQPALFLDGTDPATNLYPGYSVGSGDIRLSGPVFTPYTSAGVAAQDYEFMVRFNILNNSGTNIASATLEYTYRYLTNQGDFV